MRESTYCKKFYALCTNHQKVACASGGAKIQNSFICGFPIVRNVNNPTGAMCQNLKAKCTKHFGWTDVQRASIDAERLVGVRNFLKHFIFQKNNKHVYIIFVFY